MNKPKNIVFGILRFDKKRIIEDNKNNKFKFKSLFDYAQNLSKDSKYINIIVATVSSGEYGIIFTYNLDNSKYKINNMNDPEESRIKHDMFAKDIKDELYVTFKSAFKGCSTSFTSGSNIVK